MPLSPLVVVAGAVANKPFNGGETWVRASWLRAIECCGCRTFLLEQIAPDTRVDGTGRRVPFTESAHLAYFQQVVRSFGLQGRAALACADDSALWGVDRDTLEDICGQAMLLVNISGHLRIPRFFERIRRRVFVDIDPGYTQIWDEQGLDSAHIRAHDAWFTIGENIGTAACSIPTNDLTWQPIRQPVIASDWDDAAIPIRLPHRFTTIASWRGAYGRVEHGGRMFGLKAHEFRKVIDLPRRDRGPFEIALDIHTGDAADTRQLQQHGWILADPKTAASTPERFRRYVLESAAEFSVAQGVYVDTYSGWFSDRTTRYLAAGRPALVQDTGFSANIPVGEGLITFRTLDEAAAGAEDVARNYERHARAARELAASHFSPTATVKRILDALTG